MKKTLLIALLTPCAMVFAQRPNINKALNAMLAGELAEAKDIIDAATTYEKTKDDGKTWYYRAMIYLAIDTTKNASLHALADNPVQTAAESLAKADALNDGKHEYFVMQDGLPIPKPQQLEIFTSHYINEGASAYQEDGDMERAVGAFKKAELIAPDDTLAYYYAGLVENELERYDDAIASMQKFIAKGGKSEDAYRILFNIYANIKEDREKALEVTRAAQQVHPDMLDFQRFEISVLLQMGKTEEAKQGLLDAIDRDPNNEVLYVFLAYAYEKLGDNAAAKKAYEDALAVKPDYADAQLYLARLVSIEAHKLRKQMNDLGISKEDMKRKEQLDAVYVKELNNILPYWEKVQKLLPDEEEVLSELSLIYYYLGMEDKLKAVNQHLKEVGVN